MTREKLISLVNTRDAFKTHTGEVFSIDDWGQEVPNGERYSLSRKGNHFANVTSITKTGIRWYAYIFCKRASGLLKFSDIEEN